MIQAEAIAEIISLYKRHGWKPRRVLLTARLKESLGDVVPSLLEDFSIKVSDMDAAWFSRDSRGGETWEIRHLSEYPFALLRVFEERTDEAEREKLLEETEQNLREKVGSRNQN